MSAAPRAHLMTLASEPRPAGSRAEDRARAHCEEILENLGFQLTEQRVQYSQLPGKYATSGLGAVAVAVLCTASILAVRGRPAFALLLLASSLVVLLGISRWMLKEGVLSLEIMRAETTNLIATRGSPAVWLMAHLDSKSQPVPIGLRAAGIMTLGAAWGAGMALSAAQWIGVANGAGWIAIVIATVAGGIPVVASIVGSQSPGALDNASGVATVLCAAEKLPRDAPLGIVITSAEELGLAGARFWARTVESSSKVINVDTVDDGGQLTFMWSRRKPRKLLRLLESSAASARIGTRSSRLIPGILTDGVAMADEDWAAVTISRGTAATLARVHTRRDAPDRLTGTGIEEASRVIATAVREMS